MSDSAFTFLHAADLHIDSPLRGLSRYPGAPFEELRGATREAFEKVVDLALEREVRFVILAGDLFDGEWPDFNSGLWFLAQLRRLTGVGIPVYLLRGNHDAASRVAKKLRWPDGVHAFSEKDPQTHTIEGLDVALHGQGYAEQHVLENIATGYPDPTPGALNIGVLHTGLEGYEGHGRYAPCTVAELAAKGYDYWALGHVHQREIVSEEPWIVFPGNVQGRHAREPGAKGATLVHVAGGRVQSVEHVDCDVARWAHVAVDLSSVGDVDGGAGSWLEQVADGLRGCLASADGRLVAARVTLRGTTRLDAALRSDPDRVRTEVRALGQDVSGGELWIEKVRIETRPPSAPSPDDGLGALAAQLTRADLDEGEVAALANELRRLAGRLPASVRGEFDPKDPDRIREAIEPARRYLASLLIPHDDLDAP